MADQLGAVWGLDGCSLLLLLFLCGLPEHGVNALPVLSSRVTPLNVLVGCLVQVLQEEGKIRPCRVVFCAWNMLNQCRNDLPACSQNTASTILP